MKLHDIYGYLRYSGVKVTFILNPFQWHIRPYFYSGPLMSEWGDVLTRKFALGFLFCYFVLYIDDGNW
jgi:hypothetical protein